MNVKVLSEAVDNLIRMIPAVVDVERGLNKHIVNVCHLALLICHCPPPCKGFCKRASCDWLCL
ncbi:hypothetical protein XBJ1_2004 [Xenorhabdus bovienii SS-2004]|uniref:Uncharacterized protein n=1 Tax=Xenorhabdus bovienii (strain SS-2004) TaxID=406818 RepID=D3V315_XENBS|nr:hypothetical protein [Xenorhabdus bovienii]CBJ81130.1 hypothetical protein XBJ1_2004 [Xenorhabdus bovienii SS-2004]